MALTPNEMMGVLDGARIVKHDPDHDVLFIWHGGHGVSGFICDENGEWVEAVYYNTGDFGQRDASEEDVISSIEERISHLDDPEFWEM